VPFRHLLVFANAITLTVFVLVDLALWRLRLMGAPPAEGFHAPIWVPPVAALVSVILLVAEFVF
jgi:basic amino acid/polyamine antiporter, APA family